MTGNPVPESEREAIHRLLAAAYRMQAARQDMFAAAVPASASFRRFAEAFRASEVVEVATHPDLAELNLQLDGFYGDQP